MSVKKIEHIINYRARDAFKPFHARTQRWAVLVCHRRAGKTISACVDILRAALSFKGKNGQFAYVSPYRSQAKSISWEYFKYYAGTTAKDTNESELMITLVNGSKIRLFGADNADAMRGLGFDGVYLDEYGDFKPSVWGDVIRPTLSDRQGWCVFGGTPKGKNGFWEIKQTALRIPKEWFYMELKASQSNLLPAGEIEAVKAQLTPDQYMQEYECSFEAALLGAFYGTEMNEAQSRIIDVAYDNNLPVHTAWDLGYRDDTACWFYQVIGNELHIIDFFAVSGENITNICSIVLNKRYRYGKHYLPHDARAKTLAAAGKSIIEQMAEHLGINSMEIVPDLSIQDGIQAVRKMLPNCWFDRVKCEEGIEALRQYSRDYDQDKKAYRQTPKHNWCSHPSDAFRMLAVAWRQEPVPKVPNREVALIVGDQNTATLEDVWADHNKFKRSRI